MGVRQLIVTADDFGQHPEINNGIIEAHQRGIVTSASLMVHGSAVHQAVRLARMHPLLDVGLHLDIGEWRLVGADWVPIYERVNAGDAHGIAVEIDRQLALFRQLVGREPTHLDSHQHVHLRSPVHALALNKAQQLRVALRRSFGGIEHCGSFYGQDSDGTPLLKNISVQGLVATLRGLRPGITELACHPASAPVPDTMYSDERVRELAVLTDDEIKRTLVSLRIHLTRFSAVALT